MKLAIIGGSLLKQIKQFEIVSEERIYTPYGEPSDKFITGEINGDEVVYLNRHAQNHHIAPHHINYKANMFVLKLLDITHVLAVTVVGGISKNMSPMKWVVPDQIIDYTHGRNQTYTDGKDSAVKHIDFTYPFDEALRVQLMQALKKYNCVYEDAATYGVTQGPRLETIAEIKRMKRDGCDIVGMTAMPEASLARELDINYSTLSLVVNWAAGIGSDGEPASQNAELISMDEITKRISEGNDVAEDVIRHLVTELYKEPSVISI